MAYRIAVDLGGMSDFARAKRVIDRGLDVLAANPGGGPTPPAAVDACATDPECTYLGTFLDEENRTWNVYMCEEVGLVYYEV
jgi:hypothetical protein